jgi:predicted membrane protein
MTGGGAMKKTLQVTLITSLITLMLGGGTAFAATPANPGCLGADTSTYAKAGRAFGRLVADIATSGPRVIGDEVKAHLAGEIPDEVFPNSCND